MECSCNFCIYNKDRKCILEEICIGDVGMCGDYMPVKLDDEDLEEGKKEQRDYMEELYERFMQL